MKKIVGTGFNSSFERLRFYPFYGYCLPLYLQYGEQHLGNALGYIQQDYMKKWVSKDFPVNKSVFSLLRLRNLKNIRDPVTTCSMSGGVGKLTGLFFFFFLLANKKNIVVLHLKTSGSLLFNELWKAVSLQSSTPAGERGSSSHVNAMSETLQRPLRTSGFPWGSEKSLRPAEDQKFWTEWKLAKWRFWKTQREICPEGCLKPLTPSAQSVLPHPAGSHTHTHKHRHLHSRERKKKPRKWNNPSHASGLPSHALLSLLHAERPKLRLCCPRYLGWLMKPGMSARAGQLSWSRRGFGGRAAQ